MIQSTTKTKRWGLGTLGETALVALTVLFALQLLRVLLAELVFYLRDALGVSPVVPGIYALSLFLLAFLAPLPHQFLGPRRALVLTAGGLALVRLAEQAVPWPSVDLGLATLGTALFLWFVPTFIGYGRGSGGEGGHQLAWGLLLGIGLDTSIKGLFATLDLSWQPSVTTYMVVSLLVVCHWLLLVVAMGKALPYLHSGIGFTASAPVLALGPVLFLELLLFQNIGQQTTLIGWPQPVVFLWLVAANALGLVAATGVMSWPSYGGWLTLLASGALCVLLVLGERSGLAAALVALFGQVTVAMAVGVVGIGVAAGERRPGIGGVTLANSFGMLLFLALTFWYYISYELPAPGGNAIVPPSSAAIVLLAVGGALPQLRRCRPGPFHSEPVFLGFLLLALPLGYLTAWKEPLPAPPAGFPVRVMSYNLHQGFNTNGYLAITEQAQAIKEQQPDVVVLQEISRGWVLDGSVDMLVWLSRQLDMPYVWGPAADSVWGNAILSRYSLSAARTQPMPNNAELAMKRSYTTVRVDLGHGDWLTVMATHLSHQEGAGNLRVPQVRALLGAWNGQQRSVILGDFNASPADPEMRLLAEAGLKDAFLETTYHLAPEAETVAGDGRPGYTSLSARPSRRIDYIWVSQDLKVRDFSFTDARASDHLGIVATLER